MAPAMAEDGGSVGYRSLRLESRSVTETTDLVG